MPGIVLILPIAAGRVEAWRRFCQELSGSRKQAHRASRLDQGITGERLALIESAYGSVSVTTLEADDLGRALTRMLTSDRPFDRWYREQLQMLHGITLDGYEQFSRQAPVPDGQEMLFEWAHDTSPQAVD